MGGKEVPFDPTLVDLRPNCAAAQFARNDEGEGEEAGGADGCAAGFDGGCVAAARSAVEVGAPTPGPNFLAMRPVATVMRPPKRKRMAYSWGFVSLAAAKFIFMRMILFLRPAAGFPQRLKPPNCGALLRQG
jgi:hypothetical protein